MLPLAKVRRSDVEIAGDGGVALQSLDAGSRYSQMAVSRRVVNRLIAGAVVVNRQIRQRLISNCVLT